MSSSLGGAVGSASASFAPHFMQNKASSGYSAPHFGHFLSSFAPHFMQNKASEGFSCPHFGHFISLFHLILWVLDSATNYTNYYEFLIFAIQEFSHRTAQNNTESSVEFCENLCQSVANSSIKQIQLQYACAIGLEHPIDGQSILW